MAVLCGILRLKKGRKIDETIEDSLAGVEVEIINEQTARFQTRGEFDEMALLKKYSGPIVDRIAVIDVEFGGVYGDSTRF